MPAFVTFSLLTRASVLAPNNIMSTLKFKLLLPAAVIAVAAIAPQIAQAQPDPNNVPKAQNPDNRPVRPNNRQPMTPEEREEMMKRFMKAQIERAGVTDDAQQEMIADYIQDEMDARQDLQEESQTLSTALRNKTMSDTQIAGLLNTYMVAVEDDKTRRKAAQKKLGETVDMLKVPRLESMLILMGAWGEAPMMSGNTWMGRGRNREERRNNRAEKPAEADKKAA